MTRRLMLWGACALAAGCSSSSSSRADAGDGDVTDVGVTSDAGADAVVDPPDLDVEDLGEDARAPDGGVDAAPPDAGPDAAADAAPRCPPNQAAGPVVALEWGEVWETSLVGVDHAALALDDLVFPRPRVRGVSIAPLVPEGEPTTLNEPCPETIDFAALRADGDAADVALVELSALEPDGAARRGRVSWSAAPLVEIDGDVPEPRWVLFEPAGGPPRVLVHPAEEPPPWRLPIPDVPGTIAVVHGAPLRNGPAAVYAPPGFAAHWRALSPTWAELDVAVVAGPVAVAPFARDDDPVLLGEDPVELGQTRVAIVGPAGRALNVEFACADTVRVSLSGFADLTLEQGDATQVAGPPDPDLGAIACAADGEVGRFTLTVSPLLDREVAVRLEVR